MSQKQLYHDEWTEEINNITWGLENIDINVIDQILANIQRYPVSQDLKKIVTSAIAKKDLVTFMDTLGTYERNQSQMQNQSSQAYTMVSPTQKTRQPVDVQQGSSQVEHPPQTNKPREQSTTIKQEVSPKTPSFSQHTAYGMVANTSKDVRVNNAQTPTFIHQNVPSTTNFGHNVPTYPLQNVAGKTIKNVNFSHKTPDPQQRNCWMQQVVSFEEFRRRMGMYGEYDDEQFTEYFCKNLQEWRDLYYSPAQSTEHISEIFKHDPFFTYVVCSVFPSFK